MLLLQSFGVAALGPYRAMDFDRLLLHAVELLEGQPRIAKAVMKGYKHILVDEFQDINPLQYRLVRRLAVHASTFFVVGMKDSSHLSVDISLTCAVAGDPDQCIYSWRFASLQNFVRLYQEYPVGAPAPLLPRTRSRLYCYFFSAADASHREIGG